MEMARGRVTLRFLSSSGWGSLDKTGYERVTRARCQRNGGTRRSEVFRRIETDMVLLRSEDKAVPNQVPRHVLRTDVSGGKDITKVVEMGQTRSEA